MKKPTDIQAIGETIAVRWSDGTESYYPMEFLRAASPSAENTGERDLLGHRHGGTDQQRFPGVRVTGWSPVGGYGTLFTFSDGHRTGIFSHEYLARIAPLADDWQP